MFRDSQERSDFLMAFLLEYVQIEYSSVAVGKFSDKAHQHISRYLEEGGPEWQSVIKNSGIYFSTET